MKKYLSLFLTAVIFTALFTACSSKAVSVSMYDLSKAMVGADDTIGDMTYFSSSDNEAEDKLTYVTDFDYSKIDSFFVSYATKGEGNADEIVVLSLKNASDSGDAVAALKTHLEKRRALYSSYDPSQLSKIGNGLVFSKGNFAVLIISEKNTAVKTAFENFIKENG